MRKAGQLADAMMADLKQGVRDLPSDQYLAYVDKQVRPFIAAAKKNLGDVGVGPKGKVLVKAVVAYLEAIEGLLEASRPLAEARREVEKTGPGSYLLIENHCPICRVAATCTGLCATEMEVFRAALGPEAAIERCDHILAGARRCAYRVTKAKQNDT